MLIKTNKVWEQPSRNIYNHQMDTLLEYANQLEVLSSIVSGKISNNILIPKLSERWALIKEMVLLNLLSIEHKPFLIYFLHL